MSVLFLYFLSYGKKTDYNFVLTNHCLYCTVYSSCIAGTVLVYDTRQPDAEPTTLPFPDGDKRPVIGNYFVEKCSICKDRFMFVILQHSANVTTTYKQTHSTIGFMLKTLKKAE